MPSKVHQKLVAFIARKLREDGYEIISFDDDNTSFDAYNYPRPPSIIRHRPDLIGINKYKNFAVGEAKTYNDLKGKRLEEQLKDFSNLKNSDGSPIPLYIGIQSKSLRKLEIYIRSLNLKMTNIYIIDIPDLLLK